MVAQYNPDSWVVIKMTHNEKTFYKVLGGWAGGYTNGSSWRLSSIIKSVSIDHAARYNFHMDSGSTYVCTPEMYGLRMSTAGIYDTMKKTYPDQVEMLSDCDWRKFDFRGVQ